MSNVLKYQFLFLALIVAVSYGQISPGDLSNAHAKLEGMSKCTLCHELGEKVTDAKCLNCHDDIQSLLDQNRGYHADSSVKKKDCIECHSDHFGRNFDMVRFDEKSFKHDLTGYNLEGKHKVVDCRECHVSDNIQNTEIKKRKNTFLGLDQECLSCHDDFHQNTLSTDCMSCHNMEAFKPAPKFDHMEADFKLLGEHASVDCIECHQVSTKNGKEFQEFSNIPFSDCVDCHSDPHNNQIQGKCIECHTETSFSSFTGRGSFDHSSTDFDLKGKHKKIDCFSCHDRSSNPLVVFQDKINTNENNCVACHEDNHEGKYGNECVKCHRESSFLSLKKMAFFDHTITDYPLEGKHLSVDCKQCHKKRFSTPIDYSACNKCHEDYHRNEFTKNEITPDCIECHSLENGFDYSLYTLEQHQTTSFPLKGAHDATPCFSCHISEDDKRWTFVDLGSDCIDCHQDLHEGYISEKFYPKDDCVVCHVNETWSSVNFDHNLTDWPLDGKHKEVDCRDCHFEMSDNNIVIDQTFNALESNCVQCHDNIHDDLFAINGETDCIRCHVTDSWYPKNFDHNNTSFPLKGRHTEIECSECHTASILDGKPIIEYKIKKFECIDCHS